MKKCLKYQQERAHYQKRVEKISERKFQLQEYSVISQI
ncbi:unnamed protein product [Paramecium primaurelia]|uniref:Uncharacterized protein n=1 Tax=Paramecium primaurelia TaxID=5886 RepID=A0A8S1QCP2_PARPR|nr:unnamed protein product [Paramecium primaurelia]